MAQLLLVEVANDDCLEIGGIAETLFVDFQDAVVAGALDGALDHWSHTWVMVVEDGTYRIVVVDLGCCITVGQERELSVEQSLPGYGIATWLCEVEVGQLEECRHILE